MDAWGGGQKDDPVGDVRMRGGRGVCMDGEGDPSPRVGGQEGGRGSAVNGWLDHCRREAPLCRSCRSSASRTQGRRPRKTKDSPKQVPLPNHTPSCLLSISVGPPRVSSDQADRQTERPACRLGDWEATEDSRVHIPEVVRIAGRERDHWHHPGEPGRPGEGEMVGWITGST